MSSKAETESDEAALTPGVSGDIVASAADVDEIGRVVKLDRGFPLIELASGERVRGEHDVAFSKSKDGAADEVRGAAVGDWVEVRRPSGHDMAIIKAVRPRESVLVRRDPAEGAQSQVLAANFDWVFVTEPMNDLNFRRLERELVIAHLTGASIAVLLTKADLIGQGQREKIERRVRAIAGDEVLLMTLDGDGCAEELDALRAKLSDGATAVLIGRSGVGKSSLVNRLAGAEVQKTAEVRQRDGKGRHTTVSREMVALPSGGWVVDMPGVRGLGLWNAQEGIASAFSDVVALAEDCRFRDCRHESEPGCAVRAAVEAGELSPLRLRSFCILRDETERNAQRARERKWSRPR